MGKTCTVKVECRDRNGSIAAKTWTGLDIMKLAHTYGWCTRQMNKHPHDGVAVEWDCRHDDGMWFTGRMVRIQGSVMRRGIFENL